MNVLVTAIGSMSAETVLNSLKSDGHIVVGCDINKKEHLVLAKHFDRFYQVPFVSDDTFIDNLLKICIEEQIHVLFPLTDIEVDRLADIQTKERFQYHNIKIAIPGTETVRVCRNKLEFYNHLKTNYEIKLIPTYSTEDILKNKLKYPLIAKPATGRSSEGLFKVDDDDLLNCLVRTRPGYIFQTLIQGCVFTVDMVRDYYGNLFTLSRKELLRTSNGAGLVVEILENKELQDIVKTIAEILDIHGTVNMEFIYDGLDYFLMDINPRFSAGVGFSKMAGYDFIRACLNVFMEESIETVDAIHSGIYGKHYIDYKII